MDSPRNQLATEPCFYTGEEICLRMCNGFAKILGIMPCLECQNRRTNYTGKCVVR